MAAYEKMLKYHRVRFLILMFVTSLYKFSCYVFKYYWMNINRVRGICNYYNMFHKTNLNNVCLFHFHMCLYAFHGNYHSLFLHL